MCQDGWSSRGRREKVVSGHDVTQLCLVLPRFAVFSFCLPLRFDGLICQLEKRVMAEPLACREPVTDPLTPGQAI